MVKKKKAVKKSKSSTVSSKKMGRPMQYPDRSNFSTRLDDQDKESMVQALKSTTLTQQQFIEHCVRCGVQMLNANSRVLIGYAQAQLTAIRACRK